VQTPWLLGKAKPVRFSRSELLPEDWLPTTTIWAAHVRVFSTTSWEARRGSPYLGRGDVDTDLADLVLLFEIDMVSEAVEGLFLWGGGHLS
jgi:hypothetical protein